MVIVTLTGIDVKIAWLKPNENFEPITSYAVELLKQDGSWATENTYCDASQDPNFSNLNCVIPMAVIGPLTLQPIDSVIKARVKAFNIRGWGDPS